MKKKKILIILSLIVFASLAVGVSFGLFTYNKDVADVAVNPGNIAISLANINGSLALNNVVIKTDNEGINSSDYLDFTVNASVDSENIYYEVYIVPNSSSTLNTTYLNTYLTDQSNNALTSIVAYNNLNNSGTGVGKAIYRGVISVNNDYSPKNETKYFRLRLWLDEDYPDVTSKSFSFDIYLYAKNVSDNFNVNQPLCTRVTNVANLHTETCTNSSTTQYCQADGYAVDGVITYGNAKALGTPLATGDAFDCDVNGNGVIDTSNGVSTERFYYVSDYWNQGTNINSFDTSTAVLIYYTNTANGVASYNGSAYATQASATSLGYICADSNGCNWYGPLTAITHLPTTSQWSKVSLKRTRRTIMACDNADCSNAPTGTTTGGTIVNPFNYKDRAARLLTLPELVKGCKGTINGNLSLGTVGSLTACNFLFEGTKYANANKATNGPRLETPSVALVWDFRSLGRRLYESEANSGVFGARPVIEVPKEDIQY